MQARFAVCPNVDHVSSGGLIVFDDRGCTGYQKQKLVADAFVRNFGLAVLELPTGQGLLLKR